MSRFQRTLGVFASGCTVYFVMAACTTVHIDISEEPVPPEPVAAGHDASGPHASSSSSAAGGIDPSTPFTPSSSSSTSGDVVPNAMADEWHKSGSRLRLLVIEGSDGTKQFKGWFDTERQDACTFKPYADSSLRCVPEAFSTNLVTPGLKFWASADCTGPRAVVVAAGLPPPKHFAEGVNLYQVGVMAYTGPTSTGAAPGACTPITPAGQVFDATFIPASAFVLGLVKLAPPGP